MTDNTFGQCCFALLRIAEDRQTGTDAVGRIPHRWQARPIVGPAVHVLLMAASQELNTAQHTPVVQILGEQILATVDHRLHHHVGLARLLLGFDDLSAFFNRYSHRHRAGHMLASVECRDGLLGMIGNRAVDVHRIDVRIFQQFFVTAVSLGHAELVATCFEFSLVASADRVHLGIRVLLIDRNKLGTKPQTHNRHPYLACHR